VSRHFFGLYLLIVLTLAAVSWGQDKLLQLNGSRDVLDDRSQAVALRAIEERLHGMAPADWNAALARIGAESGVTMDLFKTRDIAGRDTLDKLRAGEIAYRQGARGEYWALRQVDADSVLALEVFAPDAQRGPLDWALTSFFNAAIALVIMIWIWPLTRDLRVLETAAAHYGDKNWRFDAAIRPRSQIYPLAQTFRQMAARIDALIASHKDMSNAVSHEIKTPLSRMQFEIELAQRAATSAELRDCLERIKSDIAEINGLVSATMSYAILERAGMTLNVGVHDFMRLIPAIAESVRRDVRPDIHVATEVGGDAERVACDGHLFETVLRNLLANGARFARHECRVTFVAQDGVNRLLVDDDGPGIARNDRERVFESFVQLGTPDRKKGGFGLGLGIVKRAVEWHSGRVFIADSPLGGARIVVEWPVLVLRAGAGGSAIKNGVGLIQTHAAGISHRRGSWLACRREILLNLLLLRCHRKA
jgi:two-component system OmpR family sensor kinase